MPDLRASIASCSLAGCPSSKAAHVCSNGTASDRTRLVHFTDNGTTTTPTQTPERPIQGHLLALHTAPLCQCRMLAQVWRCLLAMPNCLAVSSTQECLLPLWSPSVSAATRASIAKFHRSILRSVTVCGPPEVRFSTDDPVSATAPLFRRAGDSEPSVRGRPAPSDGGSHDSRGNLSGSLEAPDSRPERYQPCACTVRKLMYQLACLACAVPHGPKSRWPGCRCWCWQAWRCSCRMVRLSGPRLLVVWHVR